MPGLDGEEAKRRASRSPSTWLPGWATEAVPRVVRAAALDATAAG